MKFFNSWENQKVTINGSLFYILEEVISLAMGLATKGRKW